MNEILFWVGALVVFSLLSPLLKYVIAAVAGKQIGAKALAQQPDHIHLQRGGAWKNAGAPRKSVEAFTSRGFADAGVHTIADMPGVVVQLLAHPGDGFYAAVYEHPQAGTWFDLVTRYQDGTSVTYSTARPTALKPRPGHPSVNLQGADPGTVIDKALAQRPRRTLQAASVADAVSVFEESYAESMAYRKQEGISTREVLGTAARKVA
ncbi:MAG TPA: hypothetical protein VGK89_08525 [Candidatus Eisenbacteria bacterium]|jgi:hypothetical protein